MVNAKIKEAEKQEKKAFEVDEVGKNVFSKMPAPDMSDFKEMTDRMQAAFKESIKQEAEKQEKEKDIIDVLENILYWDTCPEDYKTIIKKYIREQASKAEEQKEKALEFGAPLECLTNHDGLSIGEKVLFISLQKDGKFYEVLTKGSNFYCIAKCHFKPL